MSRHHTLLRTLGLSLSLATIALYLPAESPANLQVYAMEQGEKPSLQTNQAALDFIKQHAQPESYLTWDEGNELSMTEQEKAELRDFVTKEVLKNPQARPIEKAEQIFEWIKKEVRYARGNQTPEINPYQVWKKKLAVCGGYSHLYKAMLNAADIPSVIVFGTIPSGSNAGGVLLDPAHQWNAVYAGGEWFYSDSTWGGDFFHKPISEFSNDHKTTNVHRVEYRDGDIRLGYEYGGLAVTEILGQAEDIVIPSQSNGLPITGISTKLANKDTAIRSLSLGANIRSFETAALNFSSLRSIQVDGQNPYFTARDGVLFTKDLSQILYYPENKQASSFTIPKETRAYDEKQTFQNVHLTSLSVEEGNPYFSSYRGALFDKDKTRLLTVAEGATEVYIPGTVKLDNIALSFKQGIQKVVLEEGITEIPDAVFNGNDNLREIILPDSLEKIDDQAFSSLNKKNLTLVGKTNSPAKEYAERHDIAFRPTDATPDKAENPDDTEELAELREVAVALMDEIEQLNPADYTDSAWAELKKEAQEFTTAFNKKLSIAELEEALTKLETAFEKLFTQGKKSEKEPEAPSQPSTATGEALIMDEKPTYTGVLETVGTAVTAEMAESPERGEGAGQAVIADEKPLPENGDGTGEALIIEEKPTYSGVLETVGTSVTSEMAENPERGEGAGMAIIVDEKPLPENGDGAREALIIEEKPTYLGVLETVGNSVTAEMTANPENGDGAGEALIIEEKPTYSGVLETVGNSVTAEMATNPESGDGAGEALIIEEKPTYSGVLETVGNSVTAEMVTNPENGEGAGQAVILEDKPLALIENKSTHSSSAEQEQAQDEQKPATLAEPASKSEKLLPKTGQENSAHLASILGLFGLAFASLRNRKKT